MVTLGHILSRIFLKSSKSDMSSSQLHPAEKENVLVNGSRILGPRIYHGPNQVEIHVKI